MSAGLFSLRRGVGVINDQMIKVAVRSDIKAMREEKDKAQALARREKRKVTTDQESKVNYDRVVVRFDDVETLSLSYHNIQEIKNLVGLSRLTSLKLDNNTITRIQNLDHLVHLTWLDLSFNNIEQISGLTSLTKLKDLSLFNNSIETIEGLETLTNLEVLSLGNNKINDLDNLKDLRDFSNLKMLCLDDNPIVSFFLLYIIFKMIKLNLQLFLYSLLSVPTTSTSPTIFVFSSICPNYLHLPYYPFL